MEPPKCRTCGERHWSRVCSDVTKSVTGYSVTPTVTPRLVAPSKLEAAQKEIEALQAEVAMLKRKLAEVGKPTTAMTGAERIRKLRAARKSIT